MAIPLLGVVLVAVKILCVRDVVGDVAPIPGEPSV